MHPVRRLTIPALLLVAGCPAVVVGADGFLSIMFDGALQPRSLTRESDVTAPNSPTVSSSDASSMDLAWRVGLSALLRVPTTTPIRPAVGCSLSLDTIQNSEGGGEDDMYPRLSPADPNYTPPAPTDLARYKGHLWTWDLLFGLSFLATNHVIVDVLPFVGLGTGHATSNHSYVNGDSQVYNPDLTMREIGIRGGVTFISDHGMSFAVYGGYCRRYVDEDGSQFDTVNGATTLATRTDTTVYSGAVVGISWGYTF